ncbi:MAG TPA: Maf family protein [Membranihabitans sp.]|nr:Maf family protein [Membranihabitans sp.]
MKNLTKILKLPNIALASSSPRRLQLLQSLDVNVRIIEVNHTEYIDPAWSMVEVPENLAIYKNQHARYLKRPNEILLTADTIVHLDGQILHKPRDTDHAAHILRKLSGRWHEVITGVCLYGQDEISFSVSTRVHMTHLSVETITYYVKRYQPMDKAGAYGIQEWLGWSHIDQIHGSYSNVMGLPTAHIFNALTRHFRQSSTES